MKSDFFYHGHNEIIAKKFQKVLAKKAAEEFSSRTAESPRAVGDTLQTIVSEELEIFLGDWSIDYSSVFARRAMADVAFEDKQGLYNIIDVKTHRINSDFNMPALTSIQRLSRLYEDDQNIFSIMMIEYEVKEKLIVKRILFYPIDFFCWKCLTIGALGWGQIQIKDSNNIIINKCYSRKKWMISLCDLALEFYYNEMHKIISERISSFEKNKQFWEMKEDIWR